MIIIVIYCEAETGESGARERPSRVHLRRAELEKRGEGTIKVSQKELALRCHGVPLHPSRFLLCASPPVIHTSETLQCLTCHHMSASHKQRKFDR